MNTQLRVYITFGSLILWPKVDVRVKDHIYHLIGPSSPRSPINLAITTRCSWLRSMAS